MMGKILLVSLECEGRTVSGNGTLSACMRRSLMSRGSSLLVICGQPAAEASAAYGGDDGKGGRVCIVPLSTWGRLDRGSSWEEFSTKSVELFGETVASFAPQIAINVDWTGAHALKSLLKLLPQPPLVIHMNMRVFFQSDGLPLMGEEAAFYRTAEMDAMKQADMCLALNKMDAIAMSEVGQKRQVNVLSPPLRKDIAIRATQAGAGEWRSGKTRNLVMYCGRITREKNVMAFVEACEGANLAELKCVPALVGHIGEGDEYANECVERIRKIPGAVVLGHCSVLELQEIFGRCKLFVHPARYEAWGMLVAEAAAFGVPAVVHSNDDRSGVGVCELLPVGEACFGIDFTQPDRPAIARQLQGVLKDMDALEMVSRKARLLSLAWDENAYAERFCTLIMEKL